VKTEGHVTAGDEIKLLSRDPNNISVADIVRLYAFEKDDLETLRRVVKVPALPDGWREYFEKQISKLGG
jgi:MOSC domain-containing protein YiiM